MFGVKIVRNWKDIGGLSIAMFDHKRVRGILAPNLQLPVNNDHTEPPEDTLTSMLYRGQACLDGSIIMCSLEK